MTEINNNLIVANDIQADKMIEEIKEIDNERKRLLQITKHKKQEIELQENTINNDADKKIEYLKLQLAGYFETIPKNLLKITDGGQKKYKLVSGTLIVKPTTIKYERDNDKLIKWLKNNKPNLVKVTESPMWDALKSEGINIQNDKVITSDGEIIEGVTAIEVPETFDVKF